MYIHSFIPICTSIHTNLRIIRLCMQQTHMHSLSLYICISNRIMYMYIYVSRIYLSVSIHTYIHTYIQYYIHKCIMYICMYIYVSRMYYVLCRMYLCRMYYVLCIMQMCSSPLMCLHTSSLAQLRCLINYNLIHHKLFIYL